VKHFLRLILCLIFGSFLLVSCGKVAQEVTPEKKEIFAFNLQYSIDLSQNQSQTLLVANTSLVDENPFAAEVDSIKMQNSSIKLVEITWGKGILVLDKSVTANVTGNAYQKVYYSKAYNKNGVELNSSDKTWTYLKFDNTAKKWNVISNKIKKDSSYYLVRVSNKTKYWFKVFSADDVSGNETINLGSINNYDTFLSLLFLADLETNREKFTRFMDFDALGKLFNQMFFSQLDYNFPTDAVKQFTDNEISKNSLEANLLSIYYLYNSDPREAIKYVNSLKSDILNKKAQDILLDNIKSLGAE
jgi:hypothetical protein